MSAALPLFFEMDVVHARASAAIAAATGAEAGFVTACAAAGITVGIAACMAGSDPARIAQLPDASGMKDEVLIQLGHCVDYGAPVTQGIRLAGAKARPIGTVNGTARALFAASITPQTVAAMYVVSHHTAQYGCIPLSAFVETAHEQGVPVVVDAAAEASKLGPSRAALREAWEAEITSVFGECGLALPAAGAFVSTGTQGVHTEHLGRILAEMQYLQRAYPGGVW